MVLASSVFASSLQLSSPKYDFLIWKSTKRYWTDLPDYQQWKAQLYQESLLDTNAVSPVGAEGLAQFMPATWKQISRELGYPEDASPRTPKLAINAGAYYMRKLRNGWSSPRPQLDRQQLAQASYNAGFGNLLKAQRACGGENLYPDIIRCLPQITGHFSNETITYVKRIEFWYKDLKGVPRDVDYEFVIMGR